MRRRVDGVGLVTFTVNVAGAKSNLAPVVLLTSDTVMVAEPAATGCTVTVLVSPQAVNVASSGDAVATLVSLDLTATVRLV